ncbi:MAG: tRNA (adenosine(37)-N6)-threonylcarbamoyltransferase complex ATPase subunit type 1 TsaE [Deltaproteobacteria bacterium]|nr:tRNA (adenosine(37)-N6)-threonylcarbamoyltransferase complex ATPase subunit type 1 TsaE [Deltaproteobacteria bacterium]
MSAHFSQKEFRISSVAELSKVVDALAKVLKPGDWIWLEGNLGAGKTTFVRELFRKLGHEDEVVSPSYPLMVEYEIEGQRYFHLDGYRLTGKSPWDYREWGDAIILAEWPEQLHLPAERFKYRLEFEVLSENERLIKISAL